MLNPSLENSCLPILSEIKTAGGFTQRQINQLATAIRLKAGVIQNPDREVAAGIIDNPCSECKTLCYQSKAVLDGGATFSDLIQYIGDLAY